MCKLKSHVRFRTFRKIFLSVFLVSGTLVQQFGLTAGSSITCDPLQAKGTAVLCTVSLGASTLRSDCSEPSIFGTIATYACRNNQGDVLRGFLNCTNEGYWISSMQYGNSSLCNLDASIINIQSPDVAIALEPPGFTTPTPNSRLLQANFDILNDFQRVGLQLHNTFRRNHKVPFVAMAPLMNKVAQDLADFIAFGNSSLVDTDLKLSLINTTANVEMNWYIQQSMVPNTVEAVSNAVQSWYSAGVLEYNWENIGFNLKKGNVLSFARVVWKSTKFIGMGVTNFEGVTFVTAIYTPGRHIGNTDPVQEFNSNVFPVRVGFDH